MKLGSLIIASTSDLQRLLGRVLEEQHGLNGLELEDAKVELTLPLDLDPEPKQHQLLYAKSPFHLVDCLLFELCSGICNPFRTAFRLFPPNQMMRRFPRSVGRIGQVLKSSKFFDLLKRVERCTGKASSW